ncbi:hypothetical protein L6164_016129 [Bauhinia variegata]|uniref:Uncharacterized protein n=1 Tax=Bauhinia variegata TaxID=167791 RepID=A0ACB9NMP4_BAUVA|nr:hypothetical protein L6164_016129 [Bauhinia variegata]
MSFVKILTPSDASNASGFIVPKSCAEPIFPPLNCQADLPAQELSVTDVHGTCWKFRHAYNSTPKRRRHLLTTGWYDFVDAKKLVAGDSVVFVKNCRGELFFGIRRGIRFAAGNGGDCAIRCSLTGRNCAGLRGGEGFSRNGKLSAESVAKAAELAAKNMPFEVMYYPSPRAEWSDFVVKQKVVERAINVK